MSQYPIDSVERLEAARRRVRTAQWFNWVKFLSIPGLIGLAIAFVWHTNWQADLVEAEVEKIESIDTHPTVLPYVDSQEDCEQYQDRVWHGDRCYDYHHSPEF
ncbi:MAG: hypothetical protein AAGF24_04885 [Cyanobacteria bacterium P01_H01_bin.121]